MTNLDITKTYSFCLVGLFRNGRPQPHHYNEVSAEKSGIKVVADAQRIVFLPGDVNLSFCGE